MREHVTRGSICLDDPETGLTYRVADIAYIEREDESFRYEIMPVYGVISLLAPPLFQGIPGLNLDLHRSVYVRENRTPVFVSERTPAENREDVRGLLDEVGMEYLNRLEWLIRTATRYAGDDLYVTRILPDAEGALEIDPLAKTDLQTLLGAICRGRDIRGTGFWIDDSNRKEMHALLRAVCPRLPHANGRPCSSDKKTDGRALHLDEIKVTDIMERYGQGRLNAAGAMGELKVSRATFFRWLKAYRAGNLFEARERL